MERNGWMRRGQRAGLGALCLLLGGCMLDTTGLGPVEENKPNAYECSCQCGTQRTLSVALSASADDAEQNTDANITVLDSSDLDLVDEVAYPQLVGLRFRNVTLPPGATVLSATLQFTAREASSGPASIQIAAQAADDAAAFTAAGTDLSARPLTAARATWSPPAWGAVDAAGADQRTGDLAALVQEVVSRPGWASGSALVLVLGVEPSAGRRLAYAFDGNAARAPRLSLTYLEPATASVQVTEQVCMPDDLNPNRVAGGAAPSQAQLQADCAGRVQETLSGLSSACGYPSVCSCTATPSTTRLVAACNTPCAEVPLAADCSNFDPSAGVVTATNAPGDAPVCITASPLSAALYGQRSLCNVAGQATFAAEDEEKHPGARGLVQLVGRPCPGAGCGVGLRYRMDVDPITFESLFSSATFEDLAAVGKSLPGKEALLSSAGVGLLAVSATSNTIRGRRGDEVRGYVGSNSDALSVTVNWGAGASCSLSGALVGSVDPELQRCEPFGPDASKVCGSGADCADVAQCSDGVCDCAPVGSSPTTLALAVSGPLVNQPPTAVAGADQVVECNAPGASTVTLGSSSTDPDGNLRLTGWLRGGRTGTLVGTTPSAQVVQVVGTGETYVLRVVDALAQGDEDTTQVQVVDTTPPVIACNAPATLSPPDRPVSFTATATDVCDPAATPHVTGYTCSKLTRSGRVVDKGHSCKVSFAGDTLTVGHTGGVGTRITWDVAVTDASGNTATRTCALDVVVP